MANPAGAQDGTSAGLRAVRATESSLDERQRRLRRSLEVLTGGTFTEGNELTVLRNGDEIFPAMLGAIRAARRTVDLMTFVYWTGEIAREFAFTLSDAAERGVRVRVLVDAIGGRLMDKGLFEMMQHAGVQLRWFRRPLFNSPLRQNHRGHRKVLICDETVGFTGGVGIAQEWCGDARDETQWRDTHVRVAGPAVDGLASAFVQNWAEVSDELCDDRDQFPQHEQDGLSVVKVVRGSATLGWDDLQSTFHVLLDSATERLRIATAYFAPDDFFLDRLCAAAGRNVQVQVLVPGPHADKRLCQLATESDYGRLADAGVEIWTFQPSMLHTKIITVDGRAAVIGSSNFNRRSLDHDEEVVLVVLDGDFTAELDRDYDCDLARSVLIDPERWRDRSMLQRAMEAATSPLRRWL